MRRSELAALDIADVMPLKAQQAAIRCGKGGKPRITIFGADTAAALHSMLRKHPATEMDGALFTTSTGRRITVSAIGYMLKRRGKQAGVPGLRPHIMRHAWAHSNLADGMDAGESCPLGGAFGPFETEREARSLPAVRAAYDAAHESPRRGVLAERNHRLLCEASAAAGMAHIRWDSGARVGIIAEAKEMLRSEPVTARPAE